MNQPTNLPLIIGTFTAKKNTLVPVLAVLPDGSVLEPADRYLDDEVLVPAGDQMKGVVVGESQSEGATFFVLQRIPEPGVMFFYSVNSTDFDVRTIPLSGVEVCLN
jgi:hypothetical protein